MKTTHRNTWQPERWLVVDERTGATHYSDEMVREPDTGLIVHRNSVDIRHPLLKLRPKYKDPAPVSPTIPAIIMETSKADRDLLAFIGATGVPRPASPADHIFGRGIRDDTTGKAGMIIEGTLNPFVLMEVSAKDEAAGPYFNNNFP